MSAQLSTGSTLKGKLDNNHLSAGNQTGASPEGAGDGVPPVVQPERRDPGTLPEVVWSSPISTGSGFGSALARQTEPVIKQEEPPAWSQRHIYAFESDLLDQAFVHWDADEPTLEMIPGFKKDDSLPSADAFLAESIASGLGALHPEAADGPISRVGADLDHRIAEGAAQPFQPDTSGGLPGPMRIREDGIEDPVAGWRPTGMVFFETLATPPRGTVYSSSLLKAFSGPFSPNNAEGSHPLSGKADDTRANESVPFFDFPEAVPASPPEETEDFPLQEVVVKGGGGGAGNQLFKLFGRMILLLLAVVGLGVLALAGSYAWYIKHRLYDSKDTDRVTTVTVRPGESFRSVIDTMHKQGLLGGFMGLDDRYLMRYLAYAFENSNKVKPGVYKIESGQNLQEVYSKLIAGSKDFKITIPEGKTAVEVGQIVADQYKNFDAKAFLSFVTDPEFIKTVGIDAPTLEGYLYPSTYYFAPGMKEDELVRLMVGTFQMKVETELKDKLTSTGLSFHEHVIMASLIEREARLDVDRPVIASVIFNRLSQKMPLQIDATVNYALNDWRKLNNSDYLAEHPYNTYKIKGLPPGPIASPRIESLAATFQAPKTNFLYYVHKGDGHHAFAETYAQHLANVGRYIREKTAPGMGNIPTADGMTTEEAVAEAEKQPALAGIIDESDNLNIPDQPDQSTVPDVSDTSRTSVPTRSEVTPASPKSY